MQVDELVLASSSASSSKTKITYITEPNYTDVPRQQPFNYRSLPSHDPAICIDAGSSTWRAGFSSMSDPYVDRPNVIARYKEKKFGRQYMLFGKDGDVDAMSRSSQRTMYDGDLLIQGDLLENALDYTFLTLGIDTDKIYHPVVMTERLANPLYTRAMTSELLFELYNAPSITYGIDSLFAFSRQKRQDGLAISLGNNASTVIPVVGGRGILSRSKRIPFGGAQASELMLRLAQLKYPSFPLKVTPQQATFMVRETCYFASNYEEEIRSLGDPATMAAQTAVVQFPYTEAVVVEKTEAELSALAAKRTLNGKRLQDMQAKARAEKLAAKMVELEEYKMLMSERSSMKKPEFMARLVSDTPFDTEAELDSWIKKTEADIKRKEKKDMGEEEVEEDPVFPLVDRPDAELTEEEIKEKRRQRLMKAGWEARVRAREEKKKEKDRQEEIKRQEEEFRETDPAGWSAKMRSEQEDVINRIQERKKRKAQLGDRKSAAAQSRMKTIATLAAEDAVPLKKRKKGGEKDDGFGRDDSDWAVYREVGGEEDSDAEEDDQTLLQTIEGQLLQHDPKFTEDETLEGRAHAKNALINAFVRGGQEGKFNPDDIRMTHQLHLNVERIRVPEAFFQPGMFGQDFAGIGELAGWIMNGYDEELRKRMMQCIFVTGGSSMIDNLLPRLRNELTPLLPFRAPMKIVSSLDGGDPRLEAWRGMAEWSRTEEAKEARMTKAEYEEKGMEWVKEHAWGNVAPFE